MSGLFKKNFFLFSLLAIAIMALIGYSNTFHADFQFDDGGHIQDSRKIRDLGNYLTWEHWTGLNNRPLSHLTLALNYRWGALDPSGYHIFNLLIHILAGVFAFLLTKEILGLRMFRKSIAGERKDHIALLTALIFVTHPVQTMGVTYIIQRMTSMAAMFYMASVFLYVKGRVRQLEKKDLKGATAFYIAALLAGGLGFLSKQNAITFPLAMLLTEICFVRDREGGTSKKFILGVTAAVIVVFTFGILAIGIPKEVESVSRTTYLMTQFRVLPKYMQLLILPVNLVVDYYIPFSAGMGSKEWGGLLLIVGTMAAGIYFFKKNPVVTFAVFWFYVTLSVESSIIPIRDAMFEHRLYLPMLGFGFLLSYLLFHYIGSRKWRIATLIAMILIPVYTYATYQRNKTWRTKMSLWRDAVKKSPAKDRAWYWLGSAYKDLDEHENAIICYDRSIKANPGSALAYDARGNEKKEINDLEGAIRDYNEAIRLNPDFARAYYNRGIALAAQQHFEEAISDYDKAGEKGFNTYSLYYNRANSKMRSEMYEEALSDYNRALRINPDYALAVYNRGLTYARMNDHGQAIEDMTLAIRLDPGNDLFYNGRGVSYIALKEFKKALADLDEAIRLNTRNAQAYFNRGYVKYFGLNDPSGACADWQVAMNLNYESAGSLYSRYCSNK